MMSLWCPNQEGMYRQSNMELAITVTLMEMFQSQQKCDRWCAFLARWVDVG